jgi:thiamine biosynthesis lipoprotein
MQKILALAEKTKQETNGYFDIFNGRDIDPSGIVKGWAIHQAAELLKMLGYKNFNVDAGGDIEVQGKNAHGKLWTIGIRNPFNRHEVIKILEIENAGVATSGTYIRGNHIYNPHQSNAAQTEIVSLTVIGPDIYEADRFATAAFAMGKKGIEFIEKLPGFEGYMIDQQKIATYTSGFNTYVATH